MLLVSDFPYLNLSMRKVPYTTLNSVTRVCILLELDLHTALPFHLVFSDLLATLIPADSAPLRQYFDLTFDYSFIFRSSHVRYKLLLLAGVMRS